MLTSPAVMNNLYIIYIFTSEYSYFLLTVRISPFVCGVFSTSGVLSPSGVFSTSGVLSPSAFAEITNTHGLAQQLALCCHPVETAHIGRCCLL